MRTAEHLRQPEFSQPLVTALQLCIVSVLREWGIMLQSVVGYLSSEIAAAFASSHLSLADAIKAAFYKGRAAVNCKNKAEADVGMLAVSFSAKAAIPFLQKHESSAWIACFNSPSSVTIISQICSSQSLLSPFFSKATNLSLTGKFRG